MERSKVGFFGKCFLTAVRSNPQGNATRLVLSIVLSVVARNRGWIQLVAANEGWARCEFRRPCSRCKHRCGHLTGAQTDINT